MSENRFDRLVGAAGRKVLWSVQNIVGAHGRGGHKEAAGKLERFDFASGRTETLAEKVDAFELAQDGTTLVYREGKRLRAIAADKKPAKPEPGDNDTAPSRKSGWIDLERLRISVEPPREWQQMLREVWRLQRDQFWSADMSGVDWEAVYRGYAPLVARVATRGDLSDLIWEMQGELGTSHAYEMGGDHRKPPAVALGYLGCELRLDAEDGSWEITRIVRGDPWDAGADSPLNAVGVEARPGERIVAVGGQPVSATVPPQALLVHQAGSKVQLTLKSGPGSEATLREVTVTALADEVPARYREWVEQNRAWVHAQSNGRVGYFHLPDMMAAGFAEFHRYFGAECEREALIVDVRYNRGGHVSQLLLEKVARRRLGYVHSRWQRPGTYPEEAVGRPGGRPHQRACRLRRRHLLAHLQADEDRPAGRHPHLGRRGRHPSAPRADRRHPDHPAGVRVLVQRRRLGRRELRHRSGGRGRQHAPGPRRRPGPAARDGAGDGAGEARGDARGAARRTATAPAQAAAAAAAARLSRLQNTAARWARATTAIKAFLASSGLFSSNGHSFEA